MCFSICPHLEYEAHELKFQVSFRPPSLKLIRSIGVPNSGLVLQPETGPQAGRGWLLASPRRMSSSPSLARRSRRLALCNKWRADDGCRELLLKWSLFLSTAERRVYFATYRGSFVGPERPSR